MSSYNDDPLRWQLHTKVDKDTHDTVQELAMQFSGGNISLWLREAINFAIQHQIDKSKSPKIKLKHIKKERIEISEMKAMLLAEYNEYLSDPKERIAIALEEMAKELEVEWPPRFTLFDLPEYRKIVDILEDIGGYTSFRTLQRKLNCTKDELMIKVGRLEKEEIVSLEKSGQSYTVYLLEYKDIKDELE